MRRSDAALILACLAGATAWAASTDAMLRYVRPSMRPWLLVSAGLLAVLAAAVALTGRDGGTGSGGTYGTDGDAGPGCPAGGGHGLRGVGWLLVLPLVVAAGATPGALGAYAAARQGGFGGPIPEFDLEEHLRTHSLAGQAATLDIHEAVAAARGDAEERALLARTPVRLTGFALDTDGDRFGLARLMIGCCAGDAAAVVVDVVGHDGDVTVDGWYEVVGRFDPEATDRAEARHGSGVAAPVVRAEVVRTVDAPPAPYEYPG